MIARRASGSARRSAWIAARASRPAARGPRAPPLRPPRLQPVGQRDQDHQREDADREQHEEDRDRRVERRDRGRRLVGQREEIEQPRDRGEGLLDRLAGSAGPVARHQIPGRHHQDERKERDERGRPRRKAPGRRGGSGRVVGRPAPLQRDQDHGGEGEQAEHQHADDVGQPDHHLGPGIARGSGQGPGGGGQDEQEARGDHHPGAQASGHAETSGSCCPGGRRHVAADHAVVGGRGQPVAGVPVRCDPCGSARRRSRPGWRPCGTGSPATGPS